MHSLGRRTPDCIKLELPENQILRRVAYFNQIYSTRFTLYENDNLLYKYGQEQLKNRFSEGAEHNLEDPTGLNIYLSKVNIRFFSYKKICKVICDWNRYM